MTKGKVYTCNGLSLTLSEWAKRLDLKLPTLAKRIKKWGVVPEVFTRKRLNDGRPVETFTLYDEQWTRQQLMDTFDLDRSTVQRWLASPEGVEAKLEIWKERNAKKFDTN